MRTIWTRTATLRQERMHPASAVQQRAAPPLFAKANRRPLNQQYYLVPCRWNLSNPSTREYSFAERDLEEGLEIEEFPQ